MNVSITYDDTLYQLVPMEFIREAEKLIHLAWSAHAKMRLAGRGSDCSLPHETRMFALEFSKESRDGPGALQVNGTGRAFKWLDEARYMLSSAPTPPAQPAERKPQEWMPIETAPKDGTEVLVWREDCGQFIASYTYPASFPLTQDEIDQTPEDVLFAYDWFTQWPHGYRCDGSETPTRWMPLPPPPETGIKGES